MRYQQHVQDPHLNLTLKIQQARLNIIRKRHINIKLHFIQPQHTTTLYQITAAPIPLTLKTQSIKHYLTDQTPKLKLQYQLFQPHQNI
ncbi:DUF1934 domain-containing protein, partial [Staphylococcus pettenkoferi]|uniref:DUF1934 domain-containing protein n=1 Tax=Staphylococcus pettenkoferi TaxID=170573 RepID=UPI0021B64E20